MEHFEFHDTATRKRIGYFDGPGMLATHLADKKCIKAWKFSGSSGMGMMSVASESSISHWAKENGGLTEDAESVDEEWFVESWEGTIRE